MKKIELRAQSQQLPRSCEIRVHHNHHNLGFQIKDKKRWTSNDMGPRTSVHLSRRTSVQTLQPWGMTWPWEGCPCMRQTHPSRTGCWCAATVVTNEGTRAPSGTQTATGERAGGLQDSSSRTPRLTSFGNITSFFSTTRPGISGILALPEGPGLPPT